MIELKAKLGGVTHQYDKLMKENANLKSKVATLHEHMDKVMEEAIGTLAPMHSMVICKGLVWVAPLRGRSTSEKQGEGVRNL